MTEGINTPEGDAALKTYTWEEVRQHNTEDSLWVVMYGRVYDVTEFQIDHPGGPDVLEHIAGQDGTDEFENILHTKKARQMAHKYLIGKVDGEPLGDLFQEIEKERNEDENDPNQQTGATTMNAIITLGFLGVAAVLAWQFYLRQ